MLNPYTVLGVEEDVNESDLKKRYKFVSKMIHPDKHAQDKSAVALFQIVKNAYENIKASKKKIELPVLDPQLEHTEKSNSQPLPKEPVIVPGTNITENDIRILGEQIKDPWFHQDFALTDFFGDVTVPDKKNDSMRPTSTRR